MTTAEELIEKLKARVAERERTGQYPPGLDAQLDGHFDRIATHHHLPDDHFGPLRRRVSDLAHAGSFSRAAIAMDTRIPGGSRLHELVARVVSRQTDGILAQVQRYADAVRETLVAMLEALESPGAHSHPPIARQIDVLFERLATYERTGDTDVRIANLARRVEELERARRQELHPWFPRQRHVEAFRGSRAELLERYDGLARRFADCTGRVVDVGCGRGELVELLVAMGIDVTGVEIDIDLVRDATARGLPVEHGDAVAWLEAGGDARLDGISLIDVVEHLTAQQVVDIVALAARKLRPGGRIIVQSLNPRSLHAVADAFSLDPTHVAPVHPAYLRFLLEEAGFASVDLEWGAPPPTAEPLHPLVDGSPLAAEVNANIERLNALLFAPERYAIVASR